MSSSSGEFLYSFQVLTSLQLAFWSQSSNFGVCIVGQYVYVTGYDHILVFTREGKRVTSFDGGETLRRGVCMDKDAFVYICESLSNSIQVF